MIDAVREFFRSGRPIYAECGGLMYLTQGIRTLDGHSWPMVSILSGEAVMSARLQALGYVEVETRERSILGPAGLLLRGHQFRYSTLEPALASPHALTAPGNVDALAWLPTYWFLGLFQQLNGSTGGPAQAVLRMLAARACIYARDGLGCSAGQGASLASCWANESVGGRGLRDKG